MKKILLSLLAVYALTACSPVQDNKVDRPSQTQPTDIAPDTFEEEPDVADYSRFSHVGKILAGEHELRKFYNDSTFFKSSNNKVSFLFKSNRKDVTEYLSAAVGVSKIRVIIHDEEIPYIKFKWEGNHGSKPRMDLIMEKYVIYMEVYCKESQIKW
mgnify:CR=1 FL=1